MQYLKNLLSQKTENKIIWRNINISDVPSTLEQYFKYNFIDDFVYIDGINTKIKRSHLNDYNFLDNFISNFKSLSINIKK